MDHRSFKPLPAHIFELPIQGFRDTELRAELERLSDKFGPAAVVNAAIAVREARDGLVKP